MSTRKIVTIGPDEIEREPLPPVKVDLPSWARTALTFITQAGSAGAVVTLSSEEPTVTPAEMAEDIGVSRSSIQRRIAAGEIRYTKVGNRYRIGFREVERFRREFVQELASAAADDF